MEPVNFPALAPSVCFLCEGVPPETPFVDTLRNFNPPSLTNLNGRKYVCETCISEAATAIGLFDERVAPVQAQVDELSDQVVQLQADIENYATVKAAIEQLSARPVVQTEDVVTAAVETAKSKRAARAAAAKAAQDEAAAAAAVADEGAAKQAQIDQETADARQAASVAALEGPSAPPEPVIPEATVEGDQGPDATLEPATPAPDAAPEEAGNAPA